MHPVYLGLIIVSLASLALARSCGEETDLQSCDNYLGADGPCYWCKLSQTCLHQCHRKNWGAHCHGENTTFGESKCDARMRVFYLVIGLPIGTCTLCCTICCLCMVFKFCSDCVCARREYENINT